MIELRRDEGPRVPIAVVFAGVILCACLVQAIDYEETVVWQPDPQHKYVALREVKPRVQSRADESLSPELREESEQNETASEGARPPPSDSQKAEPPANETSGEVNGTEFLRNIF
ncbi:uncharacterized protein LOC119458417 [Dermacentor silvarum]|uniref:uncharacterized protein LOC119458417 n=1 Tax=Dermacentor silvarum TaxID=543639 RepID=UPI001897199E|nr:uncharacterized protein LOC119458417 [Dermacentor silvarum]